MNYWPVIPLLIPLATTILLFCFFHQVTIQRVLTLVGTLCLLAVTCILLIKTFSSQILVTQVGNWQAPYGITLIIDKFSAVMLFLAAITSFFIAIYSVIDIKKAQVKAGFYPAYNVLLLGVSGAFVTGDLFNLYVWFEVLLIASFVLVSLSEKKQTLGGVIKYVILNLLSTSILLTGIAFLYNLTGTLNMADLAVRIVQNNASNIAVSLVLLIMVAFAIKAALFPVFSWLPAAYPETSISASALFAGLLSKVGIYAIIRIYTLFFIHDIALAKTILLITGVLTLLSGIFGAMVQNNLRRLLSFTLISHSGSIILGLALFTPLAITGVILYIIQHVLTITSLFLTSGLMRKFTGSSLISKMGDLYRNRPFFSLLFFVTGLSLVGFPPLIGFWAKLTLITASIQIKNYWVTSVFIAGGLMTLYVILKIWQQAFYKNLPEEDNKKLITLSATKQSVLILPIVLLTGLIIIMSFCPAILYQIANSAATQLLNPQQYMTAVLGR